MTEPGNNSEDEYFAGLFRQPELTRRENWDGREEPLHPMPQETPSQRWDRLAQQLRHGGTAPPDTLDIDHEVVD